MCLYPKFILNRKYIPNMKNNYKPEQIKDERTKFVPVGCGKCMECKKQKSRGWQVRLHEEIRTPQKAYFVTFSFSDESFIELDKLIDKDIQGYYRENQIVKIAVRRFLERWRKEYKRSLKHWFVTELGQLNTERIHIHGIIFTTLEIINNKNITSLLSDLWKYGNVWIGDYVNEKTINYIVKYIHKIDKLHKEYDAIVLCSPGIGSGYLKRIDSKRNIYNGSDTNELYVTRSGIKLNLPKYYRNKIYNDKQREKLWLNLLNKNIRYVNKIKIDVSENENDYFKVLEEQRIINKLLGYGDNVKDWERKDYENTLRKLKRLQRLNKLK